MSEPIQPGKGQTQANVKGNQPITIDQFKALGIRLARACPLTWAAITSKRYIVPHFRQPDYYNQESLDHVLAFFLATYVGGDYGEKPDHVIRTMYLQAIMALREQRPMYFLEKELGEVLMRTKTPPDLETSDIHWRRGQMRIMLPKGLITVAREGQETRDVMYLDIGKAQKGAMHTLPNEMVKELRLFALSYGRLKGGDIPTPIFERDGMVVTAQLSGDMNTDPGLNYGLVRPFEGLKLKDIHVGSHFDTGSVCDETDDHLLNRMEHMAVNILLFMGSVPLEYEAEKEEQLRKPRQVNDRLIPGLWAAKFVGRCQYRPSQRPHYHTAEFSGRKLPKHWRAGHWKRQWYGTKHGESKLIWIEPYETFGPQEEEDKAA